MVGFSHMGNPPNTYGTWSLQVCSLHLLSAYEKQAAQADALSMAFPPSTHSPASAFKLQTLALERTRVPGSGMSPDIINAWDCGSPESSHNPVCSLGIRNVG